MKNLFCRFCADVAIQITAEGAKSLKGKPSPKMIRSLSLLCSDLAIVRGEIWIDTVGKVTFSNEVDEKFHQRFRNVLCQ